MQNLNKIKIAPDSIYEIGQDKVSWLPKWDVKDDATLYEKVNKLAHSTFDLSKFTKVGSPVITDDGIASGFSARANYLYVPLDLSTANTFDIEFECTCGNTTGTIIPFDYGTDYQNTWGSSLLRLQQTGSQRYFVMSGTATFDHFKTMIEGHTYKFHIHYDTSITTATIKQYENGQLIFSSGPLNRSAIAQSGYLIIGGSLNANNSWSGSINLRTLFVKIDGEEVFSGNRTGIDTIKPDNYTVVGAPTISADGIASGFSTSNYLTKTFSNAISKNYEINLKVNYNYSGSQNFILLVKSNYYYALYIDYLGNLYLRVPNTTNDGFAQTSVTLGSSYKNKDLYIKIKVENNTKVTLYVHEEGSQNVVSEPIVFETENTYLNISSIYKIGGVSNESFIGSIDLNSFKIYVDGNLVYQPCLKIPYTEGQNYIKVVDKLYRDRVKDLFEQEGYNIYYTLGENDFTLPSNKPNDIVKYKANGLTVAEQRADQTLTIRGACEQGVDVNLPMEFFSDDSYAVFGVGTTGTNTASKFTPAADGNYIAIGKGKI